MIRLEFPKADIDQMMSAEDKIQALKKQMDLLTYNLRIVLESIEDDMGDTVPAETPISGGDDSPSEVVTGVKGNDESSYRTGDVNLTPANIGALATSGGTLTGQISGLYKISTVAVTLSTGIGASSYIGATSHTMTAESGYNAVGIIGWQSTQWRVRPTTNYVVDNTTLYAGFANDSATAVSSSVTVTFRVLWMRASE